MVDEINQIRAADAGRLVPLPRTNDELDDLAVAFNELLGRLHEALERRDRFAGDASHQLRTPIAGLLAQIEVLRRRPRETAEYLAGLNEIHVEALRMRQIVESLMFLARSDADALPLEREAMDLRAWLPQQFDRWQTHERAGDLRLDSSEVECPVAAHVGLLGELFDNLTDNALKYSEPGQRVTWQVEAEGNQVRLCVSDEGPGIAAADLAHVFEPFYRSTIARAENHRGVGLGLTIVERIVKTLGGSIQVASRPGQGTRFMVTLDRKL
jgi:signal transduction histidine kinase